MATQVTLNSGSVDSAGSLALKTNGTTTAVTINASQGVEFNAGAVGTPSITTTGDTNTGIFFPAADTVAASTGGTERMRIDSSGNVGIGMTPSGDSVLEIYGANSATIYKNSATGTTTADGFFVGMAKGTGIDGYVYNREAGALIFGTSNAERARFDSSGNLLVGTTSTVDSAKFVVQDAEGNDFAVGRLSGGNRFVGSSSIYNKTSASAANVFINSSATAYAIVRSTASSARFKENITDWSGNALEEILKLKPRTFTYKSSYYSQPERSFLGLIAEEVATVSSYLVDYENEDGTGQIENVRYANIVVPLVKAIQEQQALITTLTDRITALEAK